MKNPEVLFISGSPGLGHATGDLAIVHVGATSSIELTSLKKPFIYFPLEQHFEQANVARILKERGAGNEMKFSKTSPELLADKIVEQLNTNSKNIELPANGAKKAVILILPLLNHSIN